ncbi:phosphonate ABC transporter, permease protein PhnE [Reyranella sp.]|uniref:phosphonate ABC transporter, permease protein PhnE n=1 Tax=Reyranella sp. TaxID=1929291 RepID=UPI0012088166|nr:phosphonate ABC transporter, permease protein PhnE [Reyranella sp.]TAJ88102.1 MAG: phosphonate ABC transporter, permease protein PhnE [Reyranella sp.]
MSIGTLQFVVNKPRGPLGWWILVPILGLSLAVLWWAAVGTHLSVSGLIGGLPWIGDFISRMLPPNFAFMQKLVRPAVETVQIALWGTLLGIVLALPVCFFAARNLSPYAWVFHGLRQVLNVMRGINEIILALIFVAAVGLGPFAGVLAIAIHGAGMLGKFFAEAIEEIDEGPLDALRAAGAGTLQRIVFGVLPQVLPAWIGVVLYRFETNIRVSTVLGMVGAGGIGFELISSMKLFAYEDTAACVIVILILVLAADLLSSKLRAMIR